MQRMALIVVGTFLVIFGFFAFWNKLNPQWLPVSVDESTDTYSIDGKYPQVGIPAIDAQIQKIVDDTIVEFKKLPPVPHDSAAGKNTLTILFDRPYVGFDYVSVRLVVSEYTGGAHPITLVSGLNFNRETGKKLELNDALALIGKTVRDVSEKSTAQFEQMFREGFFREGADSNPENYSSFLVSEELVTFIFQQYQVAAYVNGPQEVSFKRVK